MMQLENRPIVITGASSGIGQAITLRLAEEKAQLHLVARNHDALAQLASQAENLGATASCHSVDLCDDDALAHFVRDIQAQCSELAVLVHSAGMVSLGAVADSPVSDLDAQYRLNLRAPYLLSQQLLPLLQRGRGYIIFINSGAGLNARANWSQYAASKHGLKALADSLRQEVASDGIRVVSIYPGRTASPMQQRVRELEGQNYNPEDYIQPRDVSEQVIAALRVSDKALLSDVRITSY